MASSLLAGVSGLRAHQQLLDVVGNNLANINTTGFKAQRARFSDVLSETLRPAKSPVAGRVGGTDPIQIGLGVKVAGIDTDLKQGSLEVTGGNLDLAIRGDGFFVVSDGLQNLFTRAGAFAVDENNTLVDAGTGFKVQRFGSVGEGSATAPAFQSPGDNSITIPFGIGIPAKATTNVKFQGSLDALAVGPLKETLTSIEQFTIDAAGTPATLVTQLNDLLDNTVDYVDGDIIKIEGTTVDGTAVSATFTYGAANEGTTLGDLVTAISSAFTGATASLDSDGNLVLQADKTGPATLSLTLTDDTTNTGSSNFSSHSMTLTTDGKDGDTVSTAIAVYDPQGTAHSLTLTFQKQGNNLWDLTASIDAGNGTIIDDKVEGLRFNEDGSFQQVTGSGTGDPDISFQIDGLSPQTIGFSFGSSNGFDGVTQFGGTSSVAATEQDGFAAGFLLAVSVAPDAAGLIEGVFTNGRKLPIAQLAIATFKNPGGLGRHGDNYFEQTTNSGESLIGTALSGGRGSISTGVLESSNVDTALEFTRLITAQRGFQVNARTITITDQVLEELANIVR